MASSKGVGSHKWGSTGKPIDVSPHVLHNGSSPALWVCIPSSIEGIGHAIQQGVQLGINCPEQSRRRGAIPNPLHPAESAYHIMHPLNLISLPKENGNDASYPEDEVSSQQDDAGIPVHLAGYDVILGCV